uniref:Arginine kinase n=1 Tax=Chromera velia CCMP2878 TaxID=1169474 RepID=A0A0G4I8I4_9ALVE|eukprot:Cvel_11943.t1-p1 / transcript=Cvel_11943.t1 / gene=Cvel_11943 / organism=Chromera_velia_CCMP2878 / gene_product=Arginine kinase, putative / transcript_product=Arginine kinase, putative / location=Cvel_scaffold765:24278-26455(+) / protein_length=365 / sequence_SO=supercontig / SO=protein_coding / is_pseudo=false
MAAEILANIEAAKKSNPDNLMAKFFDVKYYKSLPEDKKARLLKICKSGADNPDSGMGMYAMNPTDYDDFQEYFDQTIKAYHKIEGDVKHVNNWEFAGVEGLPASGKLDLKELGLAEVSMRVRVGRNLADFPLPGAMTKEDRIKMEEKMVGAFEKLMADPAYGGTYHSLTPDTKYSIDDNKYNELVKAHIMFKDMAADSYLASAGIASEWPFGRGCYVSEDKGFIVWVGEEDHLRIMCMKKGSVLNEVFDRLKTACDVVEQVSGKFAKSPTYGYVTSCPTNLGTGMRASVHIKIPKLTADGTDTKAKAVAKPLGLSVRGMGGEHTPIGADGTVDISPSARLMIQEAQIVCNLYKGIKLLLEEEAKA